MTSNPTTTTTTTKAHSYNASMKNKKRRRLYTHLKVYTHNVYLNDASLYTMHREHQIKKWQSTSTTSARTISDIINHNMHRTIAGVEICRRRIASSPAPRHTSNASHRPRQRSVPGTDQDATHKRKSRASSFLAPPQQSTRATKKLKPAVSSTSEKPLFAGDNETEVDRN